MVTKKKTKFFKSLRFRILVILLILGIVPSAIVTQLMISNYEKQAIEVKVSEVSTQCAILCNQIIKENYLNDSSSQSVNSKLELLSNVYGGRMVIVDRDLKVVADTYHVDEGRTLISPKVVKCFKNGEVTNYRRYGQMLEMAVPVKSADVPQIQGAMLVNISISDIMATVGEQEQMAMLLTGIIVALSVHWCCLPMAFLRFWSNRWPVLLNPSKILLTDIRKMRFQFRIIQKQSLLRMHSIRCLHV